VEARIFNQAVVAGFVWNVDGKVVMDKGGEMDGKVRRKTVLDKGFVELEKFVGGDKAVIRGARICYQSEPKTTLADVALINRLMKNKHNTPFEHAVFRFYVKCPIFIARQWLRHRIGTFNEKSLRYCVAEEDYYLPIYEAGDLNIFDEGMYKKAIKHAFQTYRNLLKLGYRREIARGVLPLATYTEFIWTVNAWSLMNWLHKRLQKSAQKEHREYAIAVMEMFDNVMPITATAFRRYYEG